MSGEAQLEALLKIINTSARQAISEYKKGGNQVPTINSRTYHPLDFAIDTVALKKAARLLEGACQQLCASLAPPQHTVQNYAMSFEWICVGVVTRAKVTDVLENHPKGLHVDELAKLVHLEKGKLARVLRLLATKGCFTEVTPNTFANNRISLVILSSSSTGVLSRIEAEDVSQGAAVLYETMTADRGLNGTFFDWIHEDADRRENYHRAMDGLSYVMGSLSVLHHYPWNEVKTVCDVGSSVGTVSLPLSKMYPHLKITDQDLPEVLDRAKDVWAKDAPEALQTDQIEFVPLNFFEGNPVKGQDVYYLRNIIHDWPDVEAATILRNVRAAMASHSRLLIHDYVLTCASCDPTGSGKSYGLDVAPEPLLPNFGNGNNRMYQQDINMWLVHNAKERTLDDSIKLGPALGQQHQESDAPPPFQRRPSLIYSNANSARSHHNLKPGCLGIFKRLPNCLTKSP